MAPPGISLIRTGKPSKAVFVGTKEPLWVWIEGFLRIETLCVCVCVCACACVRACVCVVTDSNQQLDSLYTN